MNSQVSVFRVDTNNTGTLQCGAGYSNKQTKSPVNAIRKHKKYTSQQKPAKHKNTNPHLVIPMTQTQKPALKDPNNNRYNANSFQKQTKPHPEISYGETENPFNKQTVAFGIKEKTQMCTGTVWHLINFINFNPNQPGNRKQQTHAVKVNSVPVDKALPLVLLISKSKTLEPMARENYVRAKTLQ